MKIEDPVLARHVEGAAASVQAIPEDQRPICGLLDAYFWFMLKEGEESPRVREAEKLLLCAELRPALRKWYKATGEEINPAALEIRTNLGQLAGERFGSTK